MLPGASKSNNIAQWLVNNYEVAEGLSLPRQTVYEQVRGRCGCLFVAAVRRIYSGCFVAVVSAAVLLVSRLSLSPGRASRTTLRSGWSTTMRSRRSSACPARPSTSRYEAVGSAAVLLVPFCLYLYLYHPFSLVWFPFVPAAATIAVRTPEPFDSQQPVPRFFVDAVSGP